MTDTMNDRAAQPPDSLEGDGEDIHGLTYADLVLAPDVEFADEETSETFSRIFGERLEGVFNDPRGRDATWYFVETDLGNVVVGTPTFQPNAPRQLRSLVVAEEDGAMVSFVGWLELPWYFGTDDTAEVSS